MEKVVGSLVGVSYHTFDIIYDLLFTTERVIAFIIQHPTDIPLRPTWREFFFGGMLTKRTEQPERAKITQTRRRTLQEKSIDELVTVNPFNFEIRYREVTSVEIKRGLFQSQLRFDTSKLSTTRKIISFTLSKKQIPDAQRLLELVLASKIEGRWFFLQWKNTISVENGEFNKSQVVPRLSQLHFMSWALLSFSTKIKGYNVRLFWFFVM